MKRSSIVFVFIAVAMGLTTARADEASNVTQVGHDPLFGRGMNAALAIYDHYVYIGNRTDSSTVCVGASGATTQTGCPHPHPGILIVDVADPAHPKDVGEIGAPHAGVLGETTRELRVWPQRKLLIVMHFRCSSGIHACPKGTDKDFSFGITFFDLSDPTAPKFLSEYVPSSAKGVQVKPHEMFLWTDPRDADRALLYLSTPTISVDPSMPNLLVADISAVTSGGAVREIAQGNWNSLFPGTDRPDYPFISESKGECGPYDCNLFVHSMSVSPDGARAFLSMEAGQFLVLDTTAAAHAVPGAQPISLDGDLITDPKNRPVWGQTPADPRAVPSNCTSACANGHSALKVPGRPLVLTTDEVYGTYTSPNAGCPWGWERLIDIRDQAHPVIVGEYRIAQDEPSFCGTAADTDAMNAYASYSSHNPTVTRDLAIVAWHSGGLQISDISDPAHPTQAGYFSPTPLSHVATEDPALGRGGSKVIFWSYPIVRDGLIYVVDVRNGLYILKYTGPHADEVSSLHFLEGNSTLGDAARIDNP